MLLFGGLASCKPAIKKNDYLVSFNDTTKNQLGYKNQNGEVVIKPLFDCAWPFENGIAKVSTDCKTQLESEHSSWISDHWFYIDKTGKKVAKPLTTTLK